MVCPAYVETYPAAICAPGFPLCIPEHALAGVRREMQRQAWFPRGVEENSFDVPDSSGLLQHLRRHNPTVALCYKEQMTH